MGRLRLGVIGAGAWAMAQHLPAFAAHPDEVEPLIVNRRDPAMLRECQERFGFERATTDWHEVIDAGPDLVVIASSASGHYEQTRAARTPARTSCARSRSCSAPTRRGTSSKRQRPTIDT